jgi:anti-sigma B factor antagonist
MSESPARLFIESDARGLILTGELDAHTAPLLTDALDPFSSVDDVRIDFAGVEFMDSSGLRVLVEAHQNAVDGHRALTIERPSRTVHRLLEISGLIDHLRVEQSD